MSKERPIIFDGESVRAILAGRKSQTRRVAKSERYPYQKGDVLWVRETWLYVGPGSGSDLPEYIEEAANTIKTPDNCWYRADMSDEERNEYAWTSPIFMPESAARIKLVVEDIRREPLQDITLGDIQKEGFRGLPEQYEMVSYPEALIMKREGFSWWIERWNEINAKRGYSWDSNPLVYVITFRRHNNGNSSTGNPDGTR